MRFLRILVPLALALAACGRERAPAEAGLSPESLARPASMAGAEVPAAPVVPADAPRVVFLGDSIAAGLHLEPHEAFPAVLERRLAAEGVPFRAVNAGVSGDTTAGGLGRLDWLLKQEPEFLVVELGGNDGLRGQPVEAIEQRLRAIVTRAEERGVRVLLLGVQLPPSLGHDYVAAFEAVYPRVAEELGCAFVPRFLEGVGGVDGMMQEDGIHPTARGHARIAETVAPVLRGLLEARPALDSAQPPAGG